MSLSDVLSLSFGLLKLTFLRSPKTVLVNVSGAAAPGSLRVRTADVLVHGVTRPLEFVIRHVLSRPFILGTLKKASAAAFQGTGSDPL